MPATGQTPDTEPTGDGTTAAAAAPSRRRRPGVALAVRLAVVAGVLVVAGAGVWFVTSASAPQASPTTTDIPALSVRAADVRPGSVAPVSARAAGGADPGTSPQSARPSGGDPLDGWAKQVAAVTGIPARALRAYGNAELAMRSADAGCRISWATLAGIGRIESNHGQYGGAVLGADGRPSKPIIGVPLDGSAGVRAITDTDGGRYDGDPVADRAVGPMQFIPSTWAKWAADGNGDHRGDPQQIDDAAFGAARYLCAGGRDMASPSGWWSGVLSYNNSTEYAQKVFGLADEYAKSAQRAQAG
ncbi:lytic murein transglycosylase [Amycolatopsis ultiminotia]|uniref:Lytic murein transglycosylase n=1 Tax=Amycolatopsis ultiminotia TaxID=543629 RepID=A0ABP6VCL1_9PSEU